MQTLSKLLLVSAALATVSACSSEMSEEEKEIYEARKAEEAKKPTNLTAIAQANPDLSTASTAVGLSGVAEELKDGGPFTAFVGTNDAFNKIGAEELNGLMTPEKKGELANILKYHLVEGNLTSADIAKSIGEGDGSASLTTVQGGSLKASLDGDKVVLEDGNGNKAIVTEADVKASNGVIHIIDTVLMP